MKKRFKRQPEMSLEELVTALYRVRRRYNVNRTTRRRLRVLAAVIKKDPDLDKTIVRLKNFIIEYAVHESEAFRAVISKLLKAIQYK